MKSTFKCRLADPDFTPEDFVEIEAYTVAWAVELYLHRVYNEGGHDWMHGEKLTIIVVDKTGETKYYESELEYEPSFTIFSKESL